MLKRAGRALFLLALAVWLHAQGLREAARLDAEGKCGEAEALYQSALAGGPPSIALLNNAANHYLVCGQEAKAQAYFERVLTINPAHVNANLQLARIATGQKQGKKALTYLARVNESDVNILLLRAEALHWAGQPQAALTILTQVESEARGDARLLYLAGLTFARLALYERAEGAFNAALARRPDDYEILVQVGRAAARAGHTERAQRALEAALKLRPDDVGVLAELGRVSAEREDHRRAVFLFAKARQLAPGNPELLLMLAHAAEDAGYWEDAAAAYDEYVTLRPEDDTARRDRARAYGATESLRDQAGRELAWYLKKHPGDPLAHYIFAQVFWSAEPQESVRHLSETVRLDPNSVAFRFSRAWMLQRLGDMAGSLPDLEAARRLAPGNARIPDMMGLAYLALDRPAEAEKVLRQALAQAPNDPEVVMHLGRALMALGREEEAGIWLKKYQEIRPQASPPVRRRFGMIELATLPAPQQRAREIERFRAEARNHPDRPDYQLRLSSLLLADGRRDEALGEFRRLLELNALSQVWEDAGSLLLSAGEFTVARQFLERAARDRPSARLNLAIALFQSEGAGPALDYLAQLPSAEVGGDALLLKAAFLEAAGRRPESEQALAAALRQKLTRPAVVQRAVLLLVRLERTGDALKLLDDAIVANPEEPDPPLTKALVLALMNRSAAAEQLLKQVESRWPEWDRPYLVHGLLLERAARRSEAKQRLQTAAALGSRDPALECGLARLSGLPEKAGCSCRNALAQLLGAGCLDRN